MSRPLRPTPTPPGLISPSFMLTSVTRPPSGRVAVVHRVHRAVRRARRRRAPDARGDRPVADLLAFHVAARRVRRHRLRHAAGVELRVATRLDDRQRDARAEPEHGHDREHRVALALVLDHPAERERERERDDEDRVELEEVAQLRGVLERVGGVHVEEAAAVGAELLDRDLARDRPARDLLRRARRPCARCVKPWVFWITPQATSTIANDERRAAAGSATWCARGRPRSCRSCASRPARARGSARPSRPCPRPRRRSSGR